MDNPASETEDNLPNQADAETPPGEAERYDQWEVVEEIHGQGEAEVLRGLLEANGIPVVLSQEGAGKYAYPVNIGPLGLVQVLTPVELHDQVLELLESFRSNNLPAGEEPGTP